jgi:hypothetical protein
MMLAVYTRRQWCAHKAVTGTHAVVYSSVVIGPPYFGDADCTVASVIVGGAPCQTRYLRMLIT